MGQDVVVNDELESGRRLIAILREAGFDTHTAFWAKPEDRQWRLYLATPLVDEQGPLAAYRLTTQVIFGAPELGLDPSDVRAIGVNDPMAVAAREATRPRFPVGPDAKPYTGITRFRGRSLGGTDVDGAYIYPATVAGVA